MVFEDQIQIDGTPSNQTPKDDSPLTPADYAGQEKTWKLLKSKHANYDQRALQTKKEDLLYQGGFCMNQPEIAALFCPKLKNEESTKDFEDRVASAAYVPTFSKLITGLISNLYSQDLSVMEATDHDDATTLGDEFTDNLRDFYKQFHNDCDGNGTNLHDFMREATTQALVHSFNYFGVDYDKGEVDNLLQQEQQGLDQPKLYRIDTNSVYDYQFQETNCNEFNWLKLVDCQLYQPTPFSMPQHIYYVKTWFLKDGLANYECYQSEPLPIGKEPKDKDILKKVDQGTTSFARIPVFYFHLDAGIAVGAKLAPMASEHFNRTTLENHATNRACLTIPVIYRGEMMPGDGGLPDPSALNMQRGLRPRAAVNNKGIVELGSYTQDRLEIVEATGNALSFIHTQNEDLDEKMHSVVHQMGQSLKQSHSKSGKSGLSKQEDRRSTEMLLTAIADEIYAITEKVFATIAKTRGEDIVWDVKGLSTIAQEDRLVLAQEAAALDNIPIPSITFRKEYHYLLASRLLEGTDQRTLQTIRMEIEDGLDQEASLAPSGQPATSLPGQPMQLGQDPDKQPTKGKTK